MPRFWLSVTVAGVATANLLSAQADSGRRVSPETFADYVQQDAARLGMPAMRAGATSSKALRIGYGFGVYGMGVARLWEVGGTWRACEFLAEGQMGFRPIQPELSSDSVAAIWKAAIDSGLRKLPRFPDRGSDNRLVLDGTSYVVEWF